MPKFEMLVTVELDSTNAGKVRATLKQTGEQDPRVTVWSTTTSVETINPPDALERVGQWAAKVVSTRLPGRGKKR